MKWGMTKAFFPLFKNNLRVMFTMEKDKKLKRKAILMYALLAIALLPMLGIGCYLVYMLISSFMNLLPSEQFNATLSQMVSSIMFMSEIIVLFLGLFTTISILFNSKDSEFLMALPVKPLDIFLAKFATIYLLQLGLALTIQLPTLLTIGIAAKIQNVAFYILGLLGSVLTPFVPLFVISIIAIPLEYIISYFKKNNIIGIIVALLLFCGFFAGYYYMIFVLQKSMIEGGSMDIATIQSVAKILEYIVYPNKFLSMAMFSNGVQALKNFCIFLAIIVALSVICVLLSAVLYKGVARRSFESGASGKTKQKDFKEKSPIKALLLRDIKTCFGDTGMAINYLVGLVMPPILICIMGASLSGIEGASTASSITPISLIFGSGINYFAIVAFSREGRQIDLLKTMPASSRTIIGQKMLFANIYTVLVSTIIMASMFVAKLDFVYVLMQYAIILLLGFAINIIAIYRDIKMPNFTWNNPKELFKNNMKALVPMLLTMPMVIFQMACLIGFEFFLPKYVTNHLLYSFVLLLPTLIAAMVYLLIALLVYYPKLEKTYNMME